MISGPAGHPLLNLKMILQFANGQTDKRTNGQTDTRTDISSC